MSLPDKPFISIVVCAFNEERLLKSCLESLVGQTYPSDKYEIIIIDDESTDRTFEIAERYITSIGSEAVSTRIFRIQHGGLSVARNSGILKSKGDIIAFIDGDAVANNRWLAELSAIFATSETDYVGGRIDLLNTNSWVARFLQITLRRQFFESKPLSDFVGCNMAFRRNVIDAVGGFQENFIARGDESTLRMRIPEYFNYHSAYDAAVFHEQPDTIAKVCKVEWKTATLFYLMLKATNKKTGLKHVTRWFGQLLLGIFPILVVLIWLWPSYLALPLGLSLLASIRMFFLGQFSLEVFSGLVKCYGPIRGLIGHFCYYYGINTLRFFGEIASYLIHRQTIVVAPMTSELIVLKEFGNC